jgi:hypothetical protein
MRKPRLALRVFLVFLYERACLPEEGLAMNTSECEKTAASVSHENPEHEYACLLRARKCQLSSIEKLHRRLWAYLAAAAVAALIFLSVAFSIHLISKIWILMPCVAALFVLRALGKNAQLYGRVERAVRFYELGVARLTHQWQGRGDSGDEFQPADHAYASDLDLFGTGSLFELLCTARTGTGRATLANWLLSPAQSEEVAARYAAIAELRGALDLREGWASVEGGALDQDATSIRGWVNAPAIAFPFYARAFAIILPILVVVLSLLTGTGAFGHHAEGAVAVTAALEALLAVSLRKKTNLIAADLIVPSFELELLAPLLLRFEELSFQCPLLKSLQLQLADSAGRASKKIRQLHISSWLLQIRRFEYFAVLVAPFLWGTNFAILTERWRQRNREGLARWLESLGQFEALLCFARYYYENPDHTFAVLRKDSPPLFEAESLGHPLLDPRTCVRCDVHLDAHDTQVIMVSGSNMSGKSTLLRSVGLNTVLAMAGAPVRAARLQISPLEIGCSIAVHDSLLSGKSRFQAEVERLTWILTLSRKSKLLFLLDEVLGGTNSADRLFGVRAVIQQLIDGGAVGIVTTHDLALTEVAKDLDRRLINVHFEEHYEDGEMRFDYRMRPGVLTSTNGINVMAALGLLPEL